MAELKYDLLLVPQNPDKRIYNQPWYKERIIKAKYLKPTKPGEKTTFLHGNDWTFIKDGLDDFRDGMPPNVKGDIFIKGNKGLAPNIMGSNSDISRVKQPAVRRRFSKYTMCYSHTLPQQQHRRNNIDEVEYSLTQHPLALYPHLEECMPPDMFEDVCDVLDPDMRHESDDEEIYDISDHEEEGEFVESSAVDRPNSDVLIMEEKESSEEHKVRNPYRWIPRKEEKEKKDKKKASERKISPSQDEHIKAVTKEFCDWVAGLGGESNNIEESTITSLFASGYETKPALSVPIHVVELTNVPPELRMSATVPPSAEASKNLPDQTDKTTEWSASGDYKPSWVKNKYGAWYLDPKMWKKRPANEPLIDPQEIKDQEMSETKKKSTSLDTDLAPMHGAKAFMEFIDHKKKIRRPEFLNRVAEIQEQTAKDEKLKQEAELIKHKKIASSRRLSARKRLL